MHNFVIQIFKDHFNLNRPEKPVKKTKKNSKQINNKKHGTTN